MEKEKQKAFNSLKKYIEPKTLDNLLSRVKDIDDLLILSFGLLLSYGEKNKDIDFLNMVWR